MPELAEVEHGRSIVHALAVGRRIEEAWVDEDDIVVEQVGAAAVRDALQGATVTGTGRHGKQMWIELDRTPWLGVHFGMTGGFRTRGDLPLQLEGSPKEVDRSWPPRFSKLVLGFDSGAELAFTNARRLGRLRLRDDPAREAPISKLGYDPYKTLPTPAQFRARLARRGKAPVKALLLDQKFAAGVGNWIADEVLYQARLAPTRTVGSLSDEELDRVRLKIRSIVKTAVRVQARKDRFPKGWLFHHRWGKEAGSKVGGKPIQFDEVGGRTTAWVPAVQR